ncbi:MAG: flavin reductase family protein [Pseudomonadales bacterium]|nr:flavin reductase family protein [Pseudomonadales bacterium]MDP6470073.1 flavin reductase family protein [Pseudomonadales bacterium]MDP6826976.1 flavin reductase family protein [Pseudomonadales bacterium]MDP6971071.1 flavin reductase family protein [Pseudomonadales bacterium]
MGEFSGRDFRNVMGHFPTGVVVATGVLDRIPAGFVAQSFVSLSLEPPLVALCPGRTGTSWPRIRDSGHFCINVLADDQRDVCEVFAQSGIDKFSELNWRVGETGSPVLEGVLAHIDCTLEVEHDAGDHTIAVGRVCHLEVLDTQKSPLLFFKGVYGAFATGV